MHCPANIYLFKVNNGNTRTKCEICSKLTIKTLGQRKRHRCGVFIIDFEQISHIVWLMFSLLTLNKCLLYSRHFFSKISVAHLWQSIQEWAKKNFLKAVVHKFHLVYSWILCPILWWWLLLIERCSSVSRGFNKVSWNCIKYAKKPRVFSDPYSPL